MKIPESFYAMKVENNEKAIFTLKLSESLMPDGYMRCLAGSFAIHAPDFIPTMIEFHDFKQIIYGVTFDIIISPILIKTEESLRKLSPEARDCYFDGEKKLKFFKIYSLMNCEQECYSNITYEKCGCVPFTKPRDEEMTICIDGFHRGTCEVFLRNSLDYNETLNFSPRKNCSCLTSCNSIKYNMKFYPRYHSEGNETILNFIMDTEDIVVYKRYQQFTLSDVISYVGGLLGLFAGISVLSIVEFFYFIILRVATNVWKLFRY